MDKQGKENIQSRRTIAKERIIRTLLNNPEGNVTKYRLSILSESPWATTHRILRDLQIAGMVRGTQVIKYKEMINLWAGWKVKTSYREYLVREPLQILKSQNNERLKYALTTYQAENLVQNYLFPSRIDLYILPKGMAKWHKILLNEGALVGRGNVRILPAYDDHVFYNSQALEGLELVSIPQLIVDLLREGGVGVEAANNLLEKAVNGDLIRRLRD